MVVVDVVVVVVEEAVVVQEVENIGLHLGVVVYIVAHEVEVVGVGIVVDNTDVATAGNMIVVPHLQVHNLDEHLETLEETEVLAVC